MAHLAPRHRVRAIDFAAVADRDALPPGVELTSIEPPALGSGWRARASRRDALAAALGAALADRPAALVAGQLHAGPAAIAVARATGAAGVLFLPGYEAICHWAFGTESECRPESRCRRCPRALRLDPPERDAKWAERDAQDDALATADLLVAPSRAMATACERASGRWPEVVAPVSRAPAPARVAIDGHVAAMASVWTRDKGVELLAPIATLVPHRRVLVQIPYGGLPAGPASELERLPNVTLRGPPGEIEDILDGAGILIVPSQLDDPFGRTAFEGLAAGVPTLASAAGGLPESVPAGQLVTPRGDPEAWALAIRGHEDPERWAAARVAGREAARRVLAGRSLERVEQLFVAAARHRRSGGAAEPLATASLGPLRAPARAPPRSRTRSDS